MDLKITDGTKAIIYKLLNGAFFTLISLIMMECTKQLPVSQVVFIRVFLGSIFCFIFLKIQRVPIFTDFNKTSAKMYSLRSLANYVALYVWIETLKYIGINEATAIGYLSPLWIFIIIKIICKEKIEATTIFVVICNIIGTLIILEPKFDNLSLAGVLITICSTFLWAIYDITCKKQTSTEHYLLQTFYTFLITSMMAFPVAAIQWVQIPADLTLSLISLGLLSVANVTVLFLAYYYAPLNELTPFGYTRFIFAAVFSFIAYQILPTTQCIIGSSIIVFTSIIHFRKMTSTQQTV